MLRCLARRCKVPLPPIDSLLAMPVVRPDLHRHLEALLFSAGEALTLEEMLRCLQEHAAPSLIEAELEEALHQLRESYSNDDATFQLQQTGGGWQLLTKPEYFPTLAKYFKHQSGKRLSAAALETLSVIAYRQPVSRAEVEAIRGVGCDYTINKLLERELIAIAGRDPGPGRPLLYSTSQQFMDYFGLGSLQDLPKLRELMPTENTIGDAAEITELSENAERSAIVDKAEVAETSEITEVDEPNEATVGQEPGQG